MGSRGTGTRDSARGESSGTGGTSLATVGADISAPVACHHSRALYNTTAAISPARRYPAARDALDAGGVCVEEEEAGPGDEEGEAVVVERMTPCRKMRWEALKCGDSPTM